MPLCCTRQYKENLFVHAREQAGVVGGKLMDIGGGKVHTDGRIGIENLMSTKL